MIPSKKLANRKTHSNSERKSTSINEALHAENNNALDSKPPTKPIIRKPTFKEFEGKLNISNRGSKLIKSQSLDHEPRSPTLVKPRPITPSSRINEKVGKDSQKKEKKGLSRRAREVFLVPECQDGKDENSQPCEDMPSKPKRFMNKLFQR